MIPRLPNRGPATSRPSRQQTSEDNHEKGHRRGRTPDGSDG